MALQSLKGATLHVADKEQKLACTERKLRTYVHTYIEISSASNVFIGINSFNRNQL